MTPAERKAVGFLAALAAAGAGARLVGVGGSGLRTPTAEDRLALQRQLEAVDSAHAHKARGRAGKRAAGGPATGKPARLARAVAPPPSGPVDVNAADSAALEALPGVGPALARRIVADRAARGGYGSMADLSRVPGIGPGLERRLEGAVTFTGGGRPSSGPATPGAGARGGWPAP